MTLVSYQGKTLYLDGKAFSMQYTIRDAFALHDRIIVLLDPNSYLNDPSYTKEQRRGKNSIHNLLSISMNGQLLWEAEFPEDADYYYQISSRAPLKAYSFSSYECELDPPTGRIKSKRFLK